MDDRPPLCADGDDDHVVEAEDEIDVDAGGEC